MLGAVHSARRGSCRETGRDEASRTCGQRHNQAGRALVFKAFLAPALLRYPTVFPVMGKPHVTVNVL